VDQIKSQVDNLADLSDEQVAELQASIISEFESVEGQEPTPQTVDAMTSLADMLDTVRGETKRREAATQELATQAAEAAMRVKGEEEAPADAEASHEEAPEEVGETPEEEKKEDEMTEESAVYSAEAAQEASTTAEAGTDEPVADEEVPPTEETPSAPQEEQKEQAPVTASAEESFQAPADRQPVVEVKEAKVAITAGADIPGYTAGSTIDNLSEVASAMEKRIHSLRRVNGGDGEQHIVASFTTAYPESRTLTTDAESNWTKIQAVAGPEALVASGGHATPFEVKYDIFAIGSTTIRPIRDSLPRFQADRGGIRFITPPSFAGATYDSAVGIWTAGVDQYGANGLTALSLSATAISGSSGAYVIGVTNNTIPVGAKVTFGTIGTATTLSNITANVTASTSTTITIDTTTAISGTPSSGTVSPVTVKGSYTASAASENTVATDAVTLQLQFGNLMSRAYPELIARHNELALVQHAREAEDNLLAKINAGSTAVTTQTNLGFARDFLVQVRRAAMAYRSRHRIDPQTRLKAILPVWVYEAMAADLTLAMPGDGTLAVSKSEIDGFLSALNVDVVTHLDDSSNNGVFGTQSAGVLLEFPDTFRWFLFAEGTFLFLDGGTLDLGIIRDSSLVGTNDYKMFIETFENVAKVGIESLAITSTINVSGAAAALVTATSTTSAATSNDL